MTAKIIRTLNKTLIAVLIFQLLGCGTLLYPERRNQKSGRLDVGVVLLDGIGLFFFLIPGIIAYAVDLSTGCIYLPARLSADGSRIEIKKIAFDPKHITQEDIEKIVKKETGYDVKLMQTNMKITQLKSHDEMLIHFAQSLPEIEIKYLAMAR